MPQGNGLMTLGNKPLTEPMLTQMYVAIVFTKRQCVKTVFEGT